MTVEISDLEATRAKVLEESRQFHAALPDMLARYKGRWVVYKDREVKSVHDTERDAHRAAVALYGLRGGQVVAQVVEQKAHPISAGIVFGHP